MKKYLIVPALVLALALCGCSNKDTSSETGASSDRATIVVSGGESTVSEIVSSAPKSAAESAPGESLPEESVPGEVSSTSVESGEVIESTDSESGLSFLVGLAGDTVQPSEITMVFTNDGSDCSPADLTEENFSGVVCDGFTYVGEPSKVSRNAVDNADVFDSVNMRFTDISAEPVKNYVRLDVGDTICGLTLKEAQVNFARGSEQETFEMKDGSTKLGSELGLREIYFKTSTAKFEGELAMEGYICRIAEDTYGVGAGDIIFVPSDGEANFPVMSYRLSGDDGFYHTSQLYSLAGLTWQNEFGYVYLGNAVNTTADISALPDDGTFVKALVSVTDLELNCGLNFVSSVKAELKDVGIIV